MRLKYGTIKNIQLSLWHEDEIREISCPAEEFIGKAGRRLFIGKGMNKPPTIFNADIFNERGERIWFGDIDIYRDRSSLLRLSAKIGGLYIFNSTDRILNPSPELIRNLAAVIVKEGNISFSREFAERVEILIKRIKKQEDNHNAYRCRNYL